MCGVLGNFQTFAYSEIRIQYGGPSSLGLLVFGAALADLRQKGCSQSKKTSEQQGVVELVLSRIHRIFKLERPYRTFFALVF